MCQFPAGKRGELAYVTGSLGNSIWFGDFNRAQMSGWSILFPSASSGGDPRTGDGLRATRFRFVIDKTVTSPMIIPMGETSYEEYAFEVRGKCIGQTDSPDC